MKEWQKKILQINSFFDYSFWSSLLLVFLVAWISFAFIQGFSGFPDPDSFYHAKMAVLIKEGGPVQSFSWLPYTVLAQNYTDHHLLYHFLLLPFIVIFPPLLGLKFSAVFFACLAVCAAYCLMRYYRIKYPLLFVLLFFYSNPFLYRGTLAKANFCSLILFFVFLFCLWQKKNLGIFILAFTAVWLHGSWPLIAIISGLNLFVEIIYSETAVEKTVGRPMQKIAVWIKNVWLKLKRPAVWQPVAWAFIGLAAGLIINPYFPKNLTFYWYQILQIAVINYQDVIRVGGEWYPYRISSLFVQNAIIFICFVFLIINFILSGFKRLKAKTIVLGGLAAIFLILTLRSARNVEYFVPFFILFLAFAFNDVAVNSSGWEKTHEMFKEYFVHYPRVAIFFWNYFAVAAVFALIFTGLSVHSDFSQSTFDYFYFANGARWLKNNTAPNSIIFHDNWGTWPQLWYYNSQNRYLSGLDPTFLYLTNPALYKEMESIISGKQKINLPELIKKDFNADYVLVDKNHQDFLFNLIRSRKFKLVFKDERIYIFKNLQ